MAISDNIQAKADQVEAENEARTLDPNAPIPHTQELHDKASAAILGGNKSQAWGDYMSLFATTPEELAHLIPTDGDTDPGRQTLRAYLVAGGMCLGGTTGGMLNPITQGLDLPNP